MVTRARLYTRHDRLRLNCSVVRTTGRRLDPTRRRSPAYLVDLRKAFRVEVVRDGRPVLDPFPPLEELVIRPGGYVRLRSIIRWMMDLDRPASRGRTLPMMMMVVASMMMTGWINEVIIAVIAGSLPIRMRRRT